MRKSLLTPMTVKGFELVHGSKATPMVSFIPRWCENDAMREMITFSEDALIERGEAAA